MGIDIRDGIQLECIGCALCIDACDEIMEKVGRPTKLIAYDNFRNLESEAKGGKPKLNLVRPRTMIYLGLMTMVGAAMVFGLSRRTVLEINVLHDRDPFYTMLSDGSLRNGFTFKILNKRYETRKLEIQTEGLEGAKVSVIGLPQGADPVVEVAPDNLRELRLYVTVPPAGVAKLAKDHQPFTFLVNDVEDKTKTQRQGDFRSPER
jgi:polyferredoxin